MALRLLLHRLKAAMIQRHERYEPVSIDESSERSVGRERQPAVHPHPKPSKAHWRAFLAMGMLNNASYVIMLASAKNISEGGTALVYLSCVLPSLSLKASAPYWFDRVDYHTRITFASYLMAFAFCWVAMFSYESVITNNADEQSASSSSFTAKTAGQLFGVALISIQTGLGEASLLALSGKCDRNLGRVVETDGHPRSGSPSTSKRKKGQYLTAFSSGTGLSGLVGYLWKVLFTEWIGFSLRVTLLLAALVLSPSYGSIYRKFLSNLNFTDEENSAIATESEEPPPTFSETLEPQILDDLSSSSHSSSRRRDRVSPVTPFSLRTQSSLDTTVSDPQIPIIPITEMSRSQRFRLILTLWPYTIPLFTVYAAEYACQAGAWTAIGFPPDDTKARGSFYLTSNWLYQAGVFLSRSSGTLFEVSLPVLWLMPILQVLNLVFFAITAVHPTSLWYNVGLFYGVAFYAGLLGGGVYVHGYMRIVADFPTAHTEFALAATSVAESFGVLLADVSGLMLQACIYHANGLSGALLQCPFASR